MNLPHEVHRRLLNWGFWCRSNYLPTDFWVGCESAEHLHVARRTDAEGDTIQDTYVEAMKRDVGRISQDGAEEIADIIKPPFPAKYRLALKLHYVIWREMPRRQKCRLLGVGYNDYFDVVEQAVTAVGRRL